MRNSSDPISPLASAHVLTVDNVSKRYEIYERPQDRLKQAIVARLGSWLPAPLSRSHQYFKEFWALRNVSFALDRGEALGILGRNGAGKSTLLQIVAGTLSSTCGAVTTNGKIAALLELGSGFSPDFTGRENVRLNAALLGLGAEEIDRRFEDIVAFADIGEFLEQPVRTYSSGMMMRLAFAVQTAVDPDLLIVDEALSVGDARFQKKCFSRLEQLRQRGTTILFVTHDTGTVVQFCTRAMVLDGGQIVADGAPPVVARQYHQLLFESDAQPPKRAALSQLERDKRPDVPAGPLLSQHFPERPTLPNAASAAANAEESLGAPHSALVELRYGSRDAEITEVGLRDEAGRETRIVEVHRTYEFYCRVQFNADIHNSLGYGFIISNLRGVELFATKSSLFGHAIPASKAGGQYECRLQAVVPLVAGTYFMSVALAHDDDQHKNDFLDCRFDALQFQVVGVTRAFATCIFDMRGELSHQPIEQETLGVKGETPWALQ